MSEESGRTPQKKKAVPLISFENYKVIADEFVVHLRLKEDENACNPAYLSWTHLVDWHVEKIKKVIGDLVEQELEEVGRCVE